MERFYALLSAERLLGDVDVARVAREYLAEERAAVYRLEACVCVCVRACVRVRVRVCVCWGIAARELQQGFNACCCARP